MWTSRARFSSCRLLRRSRLTDGRASTYYGIKQRYSTTSIRQLGSTAGATDEEEPNEATKIAPQQESKNLSRDALQRLEELSRKEWKLIAMSAATLGVTSSVTLLLPFASGQVIDYTIQSAAGESALSPILLAGGLFGLTSMASFGVYLRSLWLARAGNRIVARLKQALFSSLLRQESAFLDQQTTGDLLSRLSADVQMIQAAVTTQAVAALRGSIMSLGSASMLLYTSPTLAAVSCCTLPPIFIAARQVGRKLHKQQEHVQKLQGEATSLAEQALSNMSTVKQFVAEDYENTRYHNAIAAAHSKALETAHMQAQLEAGVHVAANGAVLCVLGYGGTLVLDGSITAGDLTGFVMYSLLMAGNLSQLTSLYSDLIRAVAASNRVFDILDRQPQIRQPQTIGSAGATTKQNLVPSSSNNDDVDLADPLESTEFVSSQVAAATMSTTSKTAKKSEPVSITFDSVKFRYPTRTDVEVLQDFSLTVQPGQVLGLVGFSGSGKSTVASLLTRLYDVEDRNSIRINDKPIQDYDLRELRKMIGVVQQQPELFRGTIRENIVYGEWDNVSEEQVLEAARLAHVMEFAKDFPDGLDTIVGPRGSALSGGQKQRVTLARVLLKQPPLLIFDEATAALDAKSEHHVQQAMNSVMSSGERTVVSIAHRLSTIRHADVIAVVDHGSIVQTGTFEELSMTDGPFRRLMKTQLVSAGNKQSS